MNRLLAEYERISKNDPMTPPLDDFPLWDVRGNWVSREGSPAIRIFRDKGYRYGGYCIEITYRDNTVFRCPIKRYLRHVRYFNLYGFVGLSYDRSRDVLHLSDFGNYYRAED